METANEVRELSARLERLECMDEVFEVRQRMERLESALVDVVAYLAWREAVPAGVPGSCDLSHVLRLLGAGDRCDAVQAEVRGFRESLQRVACERRPASDDAGEVS